MIILKRQHKPNHTGSHGVTRLLWWHLCSCSTTAHSLYSYWLPVTWTVVLCFCFQYLGQWFDTEVQMTFEQSFLPNPILDMWATKVAVKIMQTVQLGSSLTCGRRGRDAGRGGGEWGCMWFRSKYELQSLIQEGKGMWCAHARVSACVRTQWVEWPRGTVMAL